MANTVSSNLEDGNTNYLLHLGIGSLSALGMYKCYKYSKKSNDAERRSLIELGLIEEEYSENPED